MQNTINGYRIRVRPVEDGVWKPLGDASPTAAKDYGVRGRAADRIKALIDCIQEIVTEARQTVLVPRICLVEIVLRVRSDDKSSGHAGREFCV